MKVRPQPVDAQSNSFDDQPRRESAVQPKPVLVEVLHVKTPIEGRHPGEMDNPFPHLATGRFDRETW